MNADAAISIQGLSFGYGSLSLFEDFSLEIPKGSFCSILGPSGCGKSTLMKLIVGALSPRQGIISVLGQSPSAARSARLLAICPQSPALLPWLTVRQNVEMGFRIWGEAPVASQVDWALEAVDLTRWANQRPAELSGGMQARTGLARAWVNPRSQVLIIDETLSAVDEQLREELAAVLANLWKTQSKTVLFITHLVSDSIANSTLLVILRQTPHKGITEPITLTETLRSGHNLRKQTLLHRVVRDVLDGNTAEWGDKTYVEELRGLSRLDGHKALIDIVKENGIPSSLRHHIVPLLKVILQDEPGNYQLQSGCSAEEKKDIREKIQNILFDKWESRPLEEIPILLFRLTDVLVEPEEFRPVFNWIKKHEDIFIEQVRVYVKADLISHVNERLATPGKTKPHYSLHICSLISATPAQIQDSLVVLNGTESLGEDNLALKNEVISFTRNALLNRKGKHQQQTIPYEIQKNTP